MPRRTWGPFVALCVIWGIPYLLIKVAVRDFTPASLVFLRTAIGAAVLLPIVVARGGLRGVLPRWRAVALFALAEIAVPWFLLSDAERRLTSSLAGLLVASVPILGTVLARGSGAPEPLGVRGLLGLGVGLAGVVALLGLDVGAGDLGAVAEMAVVVVGYAVGPIVVSRRLADVPALDVVAVSLGLCAVVWAPLGIAQLPHALPSLAAIGSVAVLGVVCTALAFVLFFRLIAEAGPVRATVVAYVNPAVAVAAGVTVLGDPFTVGTGAGFALILAGSWLATSSRRPRSGPVAPGLPQPASSQ